MRHAPFWEFSLALSLICVVALGAGCGTESGPSAHGEEGPPAAEPAAPSSGGTPAPTPAPAPPPPAKVEDLAPHLAKLGGGKWAESDKAVTSLIEAGPAAVPSLVPYLGANKDPAVVEDALICIEAIGSGGREAVEALLGRSPGFDVLVYALRALGAVGAESSVVLLKTYLAWKDPGRRADDGYLEAKMADCREGKLRNQAAEALVRLGETEHMASLIEALRGNGWVRRDAIVSLRRLTGCSLDFGFALDAPDPDREKAVRSWKAWWQANRTTWRPTYRVTRAVFDIYAAGRKKGRGQ